MLISVMTGLLVAENQKAQMTEYVRLGQMSSIDNYAVQNINSWADDGFEFSDNLHYLSKSMGHRHISSTLGYYSIVPRLADTVKSRTESGFNEIVPEVRYEEE